MSRAVVLGRVAIVLTTFFRGEKYSIHPLDLSTISDPFSIGGKDWVACVSTFEGIDNWGGVGFDLSLGDTFLRNVYAVYVPHSLSVGSRI